MLQRFRRFGFRVSELMDELHGLRIVLDKIGHLQGSARQTEAINSIKVGELPKEAGTV
jgi:hypothetical protein